MTLDRDAIRDAIRDLLLAEPSIADDLQVQKWEGANPDAWFERFLKGRRGGIAISYAGSREYTDTSGGTRIRRREAMVVLAMYVATEGDALAHLSTLDALLDGTKIAVAQTAYYVYMEQDELTGRVEGHYAYEIRLRIDPV